jgi:4-amino-4-deoxy-L-arabinose transferase-like glycosyltransferase
MNLEKILIILILVSVVARIFLLHPTFSDENFYFNVGKNILQGKIPYKDFFFAHPPLQVYTLALFFKIFGLSFSVGKILSLIASSLSVLLIYLILKELYNKKTGFLAAIIFLITPGFLAFSTHGYGMWESMFLVLLSVYLVIKKKIPESAVVFAIAVFFRYLALIYLPFLILLVYLKKQNFKKFLVWFMLITFVFLLLMISIFGSVYVNQTISFHLFSKVVMEGLTKLTWQYWGIGFFFFFLALTSAFIGFLKKDKILLFFSIYPLIVDLFIFFGLKTIIYHYFLLSLPFIVMAAARCFLVCKIKLVQIVIPIVLVLAIASNLQTLDFYLNPSHAERFYSIAEFIASSTSEQDSIFGEPVITNYVSFATNRRISSNYLDSYLRHLVFEGEEKIIQNLEKDKPKFIIEMEGYYSSNPYFNDFISKNYKLAKSVPGIPNYLIFREKKS